MIPRQGGGTLLIQKYAKRFTVSFHLQIGVNPSRVAPGMGLYSPGAVPGLLDDDTSGVRNDNTTPHVTPDYITIIKLIFVNQWSDRRE